MVSARARSRLAPRRPRGVLELAGGVLEAQAEQLRRASRAFSTSSSSSCRGVRAPSGHQSSSRITNLVLTGSLWPASAWPRARGLRHSGELEHHAAGLDHGDPALGEPLPEPMRVSAGFFV
jgi:hypothetical protein